MNTIRTNVMSLTMLVGSALGFGAGTVLAQDNFHQEPHHYKHEATGARIADTLRAGMFSLRHHPAPPGYQDGFDGGYQERDRDSYQDGYHFARRRGFYDGVNGRSYENRANSRSEYAGYDEGYRRGKEKLMFSQGE
jgi:hypothetical protein